MGSKVRNVIFGLSYALVIAGAMLYLTRWGFAPYLFAVGSAGVAVSYLSVRTDSMEFRQKRLHRFNVLAGVLMIVSSGLMFNSRTEWILCLFIAAIFQLYSAFAGGAGEKKE